MNIDTGLYTRLKAEIQANPERAYNRILEAKLTLKAGSREPVTSCPFHDDRRPSFRVNLEKGTWYCDPCGKGGDPFGLAKELWNLDFKAVIPRLAQLLLPDRNNKGTAPKASARTLRYEIRDLDGELKATHVRKEFADGSKRMWWELPDGTSGLGGLKLTDLPLYGIGAAVGEDAGSTIVICEGEKAAQSLKQRGVVAVGSVTGAATCPSDANLAPLMGYRLVLWADNDGPGRAHMAMIATALLRLGFQSENVRLVDWRDAPDRGDAADFAGNLEELQALIDNAGEFPQQLPAATGDLVVANGHPPAPLVSVYEIDHQPALTALRVYEADEFFQETADLENIEWLWDRIAPSCGLIGIFGDPEAGKSTFCRSLALSFGAGLAFLGRACLGCKVLYLDLAEERLSHRRAFQRLGWSNGNVKIVSQPSLIGLPNGMDLVENAIRETGARCFIVDMMADLLRFKDLNDYADAKRALRGARLLSQRTKSLGILLHHTPKALGPDADVLKAGLGSQAIVGAFDLRMAIRRRERDLSTLVMSNGKLGGEPLLEEIVLTRHPETDWIEMGAKWGHARAEYYVDRVVAFLHEAQGEQLAASTVAQALNLAPGWIRGSLYRAYKDGRLSRTKVGRGYVYGTPTEVKPPAPEIRTENDAFKWGD